MKKRLRFTEPPYIPAGAFLRYNLQSHDLELVARDGMALPFLDQQRFFERMPLVMLETLKVTMSSGTAIRDEGPGIAKACAAGDPSAGCELGGQ